MRPTKKTKKDSAASLANLMASTRTEERDIILETNEVLDRNDLPVPCERFVIDVAIYLLYKHAYGSYMYLPQCEYDKLYLDWEQM